MENCFIHNELLRRFQNLKTNIGKISCMVWIRLQESLQSSILQTKLLIAKRGGLYLRFKEQCIYLLCSLIWLTSLGLTYRHHLDDQENKAAQAAAVETASSEGSSSASVLEDNGSGTSSGNNNGDGAKEKVPCRCNKNCMEYLFVD